MDILVVIEDNNGKMHRMGLESISAAQSIAKDKEFSIGVLVMGANADELSNEASQYDVHEVLKLKNDILSSYSSDGYAEGVKQVIDQENPKYVLLVMLENPQVASDLIYDYRGIKIKGTRNEAGWNSVYVAGKIIKKIGPILAIKNKEFYNKNVAKKLN